MLGNNDFFKNLNILYIDSDKSYIETFSLVLEKMFNQVFFITNGKEAIDKILDKENKIDIIVCDIYLDDILGVDILEEIRAKDENIPFILTTQKLEADELLKAIKFNINDFLIKPFDVKNLISSVEKICQSKYYKELEQNSQNDLENILNVINEVSLVTKTNLDDNIIFANKSFCEVSGYSEEELLNQKHDLIRDTNKIVLDELSQTIRSGNIWEGKIKNISKNKESFFVYLTAIPLFDEKEKIKEFIWIRFLATEYELEQKNFKKKVAKNINENRRINNQAREKIDELLNKLSIYRSLDFSIQQEQERAEKFKNQLAYFEKQSKTGEVKLKEITDRAKIKINDVVSSQKETKIIADKTSIILKKQIDDFQTKNKTVRELLAELDTQKKMIERLNLKIENREYKLGLE